MHRRKSTSRAKLKAASQEQIHQKWKEHFKNLLGNPREITEKHIQKIINGQLDIEIWQFMEEELDPVLKKTKSRNGADLYKLLLKFGREENFTTYFSNYAMQSINKTQSGNGQKVLPFCKKSNPGITQNNRSTTLIAKIYRGCTRGVTVKAMDSEIVVSGFKLQSRYYVHFRANTLGKGMNPLILPAMG